MGERMEEREMDWKTESVRILRNPQGIERWREAPELAEEIRAWASELEGEQGLTYNQALIVNAAAEFLGTGRRLRIAGFAGNGLEIRKLTYTARKIQEVLQ
jgi:hypothetical protein